jgi:23S rRNA (cytidine1920-2'-O)/16S rRNA (cytidine1409-2'-O)-methyltransferase
LTPDRPKARTRVDVELVARGLAPTRAKAQALILAGLVASAGRRIDKPGTLVAAGAPLAVAPGRRFVGRGAEKLGPALNRFGVTPSGRDALDVGASTGGFTQVLLEGGAARVVALDVGSGQLDWRLRNDPRVTVADGINARYLRPEDLPFRPSFAVIDVSFIALVQVLHPVCACLAPEADVVALVKPQFEVGRGRVGRGGIVRDPALWDEVLRELVAFAGEHAFGPQGIARSALAGARGNVEFFLWLRPGRPPRDAAALAADRSEAVHGSTLHTP